MRMMLAVRLQQNLLMLMMHFAVFKAYFLKPADAHDAFHRFLSVFLKTC